MINDPQLPPPNRQLPFLNRQLPFLNRQGRQYCIEIDALHNRFKDEIIDPWIRKLKEEGEKTLLGITETSLNAAKDLMKSALQEREDRYKQELEAKEKPVGEEKVGRLMATYGNLLAAEEALKELFVRVEALQTKGGQ
jgi:hypothetical protein